MTELTSAADQSGAKKPAQGHPVVPAVASQHVHRDAREFAAMGQALAAAAHPDVPFGPNPRVGCVLLSPAGEVIATGWHRGAGTAHAEADALTQAGEQARGATAVVTLEPCTHTGRTGPCSDALIAAGVARVVIAQRDESEHAGGGADQLRAAGIDVTVGVRAAEAESLNPHWTFAVRTGRPFVTWKFAATLDGRSAAPDGTSQWITGPASRVDVMRLRAECDAVLVGTGTVVADNPQLTVRDEADKPVARQPLRAVMGSRPLPPQSRVLDDSAPTVLLNTHEPAQALAALFERDCHHVWLEGGPTLAAVFLRAGLIDRVIAYVAPTLLGNGLPALLDPHVTTLSQARQLSLVEVTRIGDDVRLILKPAPVPDATDLPSS